MARSDLIPLNTRPPGEHRLISQKGGSSKSIRKSEASKWRFIKERIAKGIIKTEDSKWIVERIENDKAMSFEVLTYLDEIKKRDLSSNAMIELAKTMNGVQKTIHGETIRSENINTNYNIDVNDAIRQAWKIRKDKMKQNDNFDKPT